MTIARDRLEALVAVIDAGSFEAAAKEALRYPVGGESAHPLVGIPVGASAGHTGFTLHGDRGVGKILVRLGRMQALLESEALADISGGQGAVADIHLAINADSLATWFVTVLRAASAWSDVTLRLTVADQERTGPLLRSGLVMAAVTADGRPVQGCASEQLGVMRYVAVARPELLATWRTDEGAVDFAHMPVVHFDDNDQMQRRLLASHAPKAKPPFHVVPSSEGFVAAINRRLGRGAIPEAQMGDALDTGELMRLDPQIAEDVMLFWQSWRIESALLARLTSAVPELPAGISAAHVKAIDTYGVKCRATNAKGADAHNKHKNAHDWSHPGADPFKFTPVTFAPFA